MINDLWLNMKRKFKNTNKRFQELIDHFFTSINQLHF